MKRYSGEASEEAYALADRHLGNIYENLKATMMEITALGQVWALDPGHQELWGGLVIWHTETTLRFHEATSANGVLPERFEQHGKAFAAMAMSAALCAGDDGVRLGLMARWDQVAAMAEALERMRLAGEKEAS